MAPSHRPRMSYANVTATLALFVALGGTGYAAVKLSPNSVSTKHIKKGAVTRPKLASRAVNSSKLAPAAVRGSRLAADAVDSSKVLNGSLTGADINLSTLGKVPSAALADAAAVAAVRRVSVVVQNAAAPGGGGVDTKEATVSCPAGLAVVGGGVGLSDQNAQLTNDSYPASATTWTAHVLNGGAGTPSFTVFALCVPAASVG